MQHLLIKTKGSKERFTKTNDIRIDQEVQHAFKNFHKLRWINLKEDDFTNLLVFTVCLPLVSYTIKRMITFFIPIVLILLVIVILAKVL